MQANHHTAHAPTNAPAPGEPVSTAELAGLRGVAPDTVRSWRRRYRADKPNAFPVGYKAPGGAYCWPRVLLPALLSWQPSESGAGGGRPCKDGTPARRAAPVIRTRPEAAPELDPTHREILRVLLVQRDRGSDEPYVEAGEWSGMTEDPIHGTAWDRTTWPYQTLLAMSRRGYVRLATRQQSCLRAPTKVFTVACLEPAGAEAYNRQAPTVAVQLDGIE